MRHATHLAVQPVAVEPTWRLHWRKLQRKALVKLCVATRVTLVGLTVGALAACGGGGGGGGNLPKTGSTSATKTEVSKSSLSSASLTTIASARIDEVINDNTTPSAVISNGTSTSDNTPKITGSLSSTLATGSVVRVYSGTTVLGSVTTTGTTWEFSPSTALAAGTHVFKAVVFDPNTTTEGNNTNRWTITVTGSTTAQGQLAHSGTTSDQCYSAGSDVLMACSGVANDLNAQQDGHRSSINAMSFSKLGFSGEDLPDNAIFWCAVKDKVTGLTWQNHLDKPEIYTNWGDKRQGDASEYTPDLCLLRNWRLPTVDELQSIVDYSKAYPGPTVSLTWFPNTPGDNVYWTSSTVPESTNSAWIVDFQSGRVSYTNRDATGHVRLVRSSK